MFCKSLNVQTCLDLDFSSFYEYFIIIIHSIQLDESDLKRKEVLRHRVNDYIRRAETLKVAFVDGSSEKLPASENKGNATSLQRISSLEKSSAFTYNELRLYRVEISRNKMFISQSNKVLHTTFYYLHNKLRILTFKKISRNYNR